MDLCPQYLWELLEREANGMGVQCTGCSVHPGILHCTDCFSNLVWCQGCSVSSHRSLPFHRIQIWNGKCFVRSSLFKQGFVMHLGHHGESCPVQRNPLEYVSTPGAEAGEDEEEPMPSEVGRNVGGQDTLIIAHSTGIFHHHIQWCACPGSAPPHIQLFRHGLFSASLI